LSTKNEQLLWRREKVLELKSQGLNHSQIARELQVARTCIVADVKYLRARAKDAFNEYVTEHFPEQYSVALHAFDSIIKKAFDIIERSNDDRVKLHAIEVYRDSWIVKLDLLSDAKVIDSALQFLTSKQVLQYSRQPQLQDDESNNNGNGRQTVF
jgi:hypothetical protein